LWCGVGTAHMSMTHRDRQHITQLQYLCWHFSTSALPRAAPPALAGRNLAV
jgi:hypothetical protein